MAASIPGFILAPKWDPDSGGGVVVSVVAFVVIALVLQAVIGVWVIVEALVNVVDGVIVVKLVNVSVAPDVLFSSGVSAVVLEIFVRVAIAATVVVEADVWVCVEFWSVLIFADVVLIFRARPIYLSANIRAKSIYRIGYLPPIKYRLSTITLNCLFLRASTTALDCWLPNHCIFGCFFV